MIFIDYLQPKMIIADKDKGIRAIDDVYVPAHTNNDGEDIPEHTPTYFTVGYLADDVNTMDDVNARFVEEDIEVK